MPATERVRIVHDFAKPPARVFAYLAEHENLAPLLGARVTRVRDGDDGARNGVGSTRSLKLGPLPAFEETTTRVVEDELIEYAITKGSPLSAHWGRMSFQPHGTGTRFTYTIGMDAKVPGLAAVVGKKLQSDIARNLPLVDERAEPLAWGSTQNAMTA